MEPYAKVNFQPTKVEAYFFKSGDGGWRGILGEFRGFEPSEAAGNFYSTLGGGSLGIQVHISLFEKNKQKQTKTSLY